MRYEIQAGHNYGIFVENVSEIVWDVQVIGGYSDYQRFHYSFVELILILV